LLGVLRPHALDEMAHDRTVAAIVVGCG
jgi:hypothetical protein